MNILILGANGYLGRNFIKLVANNSNYDVVGSDIQNEFIYSKKIKYFKLDLNNYNEIKKIDFTIFNVIIYFSGITGTSDSFSNYKDFINLNHIGFLNLLSVLSNLKIKPLVVFPSTRLVYKGKEDTLLDEDSEKEFKTVYGLSKYAGENYLKMYRNLYDVPYLVFRICVPYGNLYKDKYSYGTIGFFINQAIAQKKITIYGNGLQKRTFTHVFDIYNQIMNLIKLKSAHNTVYNIYGETYSIKAIASAVSKKYNAKISHLPWPNNDFRLESGDTVFNSKKIKKVINFSLNYSFKKWLSELDKI